MPKWIKASERLPSFYKKVEWRNADGGNIPLGKATVIEMWQKAMANTGFFEWLDESDQPAPSIPSREQMIDKIQECISSDIYYCTRVWTAWNIGTMTEDDFKNVNNDTLLAEEIADNLLPLYNTIP